MESFPQTEINFLISISLQPSGTQLLYFKLTLYNKTEFIVGKYQRSTTLD